MPDVVNTWDNVQNTSCWVHDGSPWETDGVVERSAADIVELASAASGSADRAQVSADAASATASGILGYVSTASGYADSASGYAGSCASSVSAASGYANNASAYADSIISGGYVTSATVSDVVDAAIASGGYVTSSGVADEVSAQIASGGYATSGYVNSAVSGKITSSQALEAVSGAGYVTSSYVAGATVSSAGVAGKVGTSTVGGTTSPVYLSSGAVVSCTYSLGKSVPSDAVFTDTKYSAGTAAQLSSGTDTTDRVWQPKILSAYVAGATVSSAGTAGNASQLGGVAAGSYALAADYLPLSGGTVTSAVTAYKGEGYGSASLQTMSNLGGVYITNGKADATSHTIDMQVNANGAAGIYDNTFGKWALQVNTSGNTTLNAGSVSVTSGTFSVSSGYIQAAGVQNPSGNTRLVVTYSGSEKYIQLASNSGNAHVNTNFLPYNNNSFTLGGTSNRWKEIWQTGGSITGSDERIKEQIAAIPDEVLDAWAGVAWRQFRMRDSVAEKGAAARLHTGIVAQQAGAAFGSLGLDAAAYGFFCHDAWEAQEEERDGGGAIVQEAREAGDAYSIRYDEALCMEAAYQRRRADRAEARIAELEHKMEAVLAMLEVGE